jgi:hypothetical protein
MPLNVEFVDGSGFSNVSNIAVSIESNNCY